MADKKQPSKGYIGKISNAGTQDVKGPFAKAGGKAGTVKVSGKDLRSGKK